MDYDAAARAAQAQGQAQQAYYKSKADTYTNDYNNYKGQADTANQNISNFNDYMKGAGSATNLYNNALTDQEKQSGYNQNTMNQAQANVSQATGAQSAYNDFANTAASKWGMNAGALAASNANAQSSLNNNIAAASTTLGNQQKAFELAQTGANQQAGLGVQQQQTQLSGLQNVYNNAAAQQKQAADNMQAYEQLYQQQGGLTAQQVQLFASSASLLKQATAALQTAQAALITANSNAAMNTFNINETKAKDAAAQQAASQKAAQQASAAAQPQQSQGWNGDLVGGIGTFAQQAGRNTANWFGDVAHNLHLFGA